MHPEVIMKEGLNNEKIQLTNRSLVLDMIIRNNAISRKELVEMTGLGKPAITNIVNELLELGIVRECEKPKQEGQRRTKGLTLKSSSIKILSARWIRSCFKAAVYTMAGEVIDMEECTVSTGEDVWKTADRIEKTINLLLERHDRDEILGMCIGVPGPYIRDGETNKAVVSGYEKLQEIDIQKFFESRYDFPVITEHDAHLSAFGEWNSLKPEKRRQCRCLLALQSVGMGIGAGIILNGKIVEGAFGISGEIGQIGIYFNGPKNTYGEIGTLEHYASSVSVKRYIRERMCEFPESPLTEESTYEEIVNAYYENDRLAVWAFDLVAWRLAYGLVSTIFVINPEVIVIGPDYPVSERFIGKVRSSIAEMINREIGEKITIRYSAFQRDATLYGGFCFALEHFINEKTLFERVKQLTIASEMKKCSIKDHI